MPFEILKDAEEFKKTVVPKFIETVDGDGWVHIKDVDDIKCSFKRSDESPFVLVKGDGIVNASLDAVLEFCSDPNNLYITDPMLIEVDIIEELEKDFKIVHFMAKMPPAVSNRDFVWQEFDGMWQEESPRVAVSVVRSVEHEKVPPKQGFVRGELVSSGFLLREVVGDPSKARVTYMIHVDPKGWLPVFLVNMLAGDQAMNVVRLKKHFDEKAEEEAKSISVSADAPAGESGAASGGKKKKNKKKKNKNKGKN